MKEKELNRLKEWHNKHGLEAVPLQTADLTMKDAENPPPIVCNTREEFRAELQRQVNARQEG